MQITSAMSYVQNSALEEDGIDAKGLAEPASMQGVDRALPSGDTPDGTGKGRDSVDDTAVPLIADALESHASATSGATGSTTESFWSVLEPTLQAAGYDTTKSVIDFYA
jgi:hypothetical protein